MNGAVFVNYVQKHLAPTLSAGEMPMMDNLICHKVAGVREAVEASGARVLYLPPYSPDLNQIELVFSKLKWLLRSSECRSVESLWETCGQLLDRFLPDECAHDFKHCGYRYS